MKRILLIAPSSYPINGAEAIVNIKLLRALTKSGNFEIDLVSKKHKWANYKSEDLSELGIRLRSLNIVEVDNKINLKTIWLHFLWKSLGRICIADSQKIIKREQV